MTNLSTLTSVGHAPCNGIKVLCAIDVPKENLGPGSRLPIWYKSASTHEDVVRFVKWGLIPSYTKTNAEPSHFTMFNARGESLTERPAFRRLVNTKRCVVLINGFYEWHKVDKKEKQPYYLNLSDEKNEIMYLAGLYDRWKEDEYTCTIITKTVSKTLEWLHNRMPVIFSTFEEAQAWLEEPFKTTELLKSTRNSYKELKHRPVTKKSK